LETQGIRRCRNNMKTPIVVGEESGLFRTGEKRKGSSKT